MALANLTTTDIPMTETPIPITEFPTFDAIPNNTGSSNPNEIDTNPFIQTINGFKPIPHPDWQTHRKIVKKVKKLKKIVTRFFFELDLKKDFITDNLIFVLNQAQK